MSVELHSTQPPALTSQIPFDVQLPSFGACTQAPPMHLSSVQAMLSAQSASAQQAAQPSAQQREALPPQPLDLQSP